MFELIATLYIVMLAAFARYEIIGRVPSILHTPLMLGINFIPGIVLIGAMVVLASAQTPSIRVIGFIVVLIATINAARVVTQ